MEDVATWQPAVARAVENMLAGRRCDIGTLEQMMFKPNYGSRGKIVFYLFEEDKVRPSFVVKVPRTEYGRRWLTREREIYTTLEKRCPVLLCRRPRRYYFERNLAFVLEEFVSGGSINKLYGTPEHESLTVKWLDQFHSSPGALRLHKRDLAQLIADLCRTVDGKEIENLVLDLNSRIEAMSEFELADVPVHGDLSAPNVLLDNGSTYVTDWEWARISGWPLEDIWCFLIASSRNAEAGDSNLGSETRSVVAVLIGESWYSDRVKEVMYRFAESRGIPRVLIAVFAVMTLLMVYLQTREELPDWRKGRTRTELFRAVLRELDRRRSGFWA